MAQVQQTVLRSDPTLARKLKKLGAKELDLCFNCGNCTAICPLSSGSSTFPRKLITYAQLGLEEEILESPDFWLCNYCGECSETCPRQAEPAETMMALRRYAISKYVPIPLSERIYQSKAFTVLFMAVMAVIPLGLVATLKGPIDLQSVSMFTFLPEAWIHDIGVALGLLIAAAVAIGLAREYLLISKGIPKPEKPATTSSWLRQLVPTVFKESLVQERLSKCGKEARSLRERLNTRWLVHMTIVWGFLGLLASTLLRYVAFPTNGQTVPLTDPIRLLGTISGVLLVYGSSNAILSRLQKTETSTAHTVFTDWVFLALLLFSGLTGFLLEAADYANAPALVYSALVAHLVVVFELLVMAPFSKFAHALYRPLAIWVSRTRKYI
jgi:ferredoxin/nitrate reductase gamma subunit